MKKFTTTTTTMSTKNNSTTVSNSISTTIATGARKFNTSGGKKYKKHKKNTSANLTTRELLLKSGESQIYAIVRKILGFHSYELFCFDDKIRLGIVRGKIRKFTRIKIDDIVLVSLRDFTRDNKCDILHKYLGEEVKKLQRLGHLPEVLGTQGEPSDNDPTKGFVIQFEGKEEEDESVPEEDSRAQPREYPSDSDEDDEDKDEELSEIEESEQNEKDSQDSRSEENNDENEESEAEEESSHNFLATQRWVTNSQSQYDRRLKAQAQREEYNIDDI